MASKTQSKAKGNSSTAMTDKAKESTTRKQKYNPGNNQPGQPMTQKDVHTDPRSADNKKRANTAYKRQNTLFKKAMEYASTTGRDVFVATGKGNGDVKVWGTSTFMQKYTNHEERTTCQREEATTECTPPPPPPQHGERNVFVQNKCTQTEKSTLSAINDPNVCAICGVSHGSEADAEMGPWVGCDSSNCSYWIHFQCKGIYVKDSDLDKLTCMKVFCPIHTHLGKS